jgi:hypothetical protein
VDGRDVKHVLGPALGRTRGHGHDDEVESSTTLLQPDFLNRTAVGLARPSMSSFKVVDARNKSGHDD